MIEKLRKSINTQIVEKQAKKQDLFEEISKIDNELLELNEMLVKMTNDDAFLDISPNESFKILRKTGLKTRDEVLKTYYKLLDVKEEKEKKYRQKMENINNIKMQTKEQKKLSQQLIELFDKCLDCDKDYYYIGNTKISKFRLYYNLMVLFNGEFSKDEVIPMLVMAFCYQSVNEEEKENISEKIEKISDQIQKLL